MSMTAFSTPQTTGLTENGEIGGLKSNALFSISECGHKIKKELEMADAFQASIISRFLVFLKTGGAIRLHQ